MGKLTRTSCASEADFDLRRFSGRVALLIDADGRQQVVVRSLPQVLLLTLTGACALDCALRITFLNHGLDGSARASQAFKELAACISSRAPRRPPTWTPRSLSKRNTLIAIDGDAAGATYREIARVIFSARYTDAAWRKNQSLKDGVRHALQRGHTMMDGGYRRLLR
jgi:hypothetical protein